MKKQEIVVITGASAGVGRAIAWEFAKKGARIGLLARGSAGLKGVQKEVESLGGSAIAIQTDVADPEQIEAAAEKIEQHFGPIDIWINDAMASVFSPAKEMSPAEYKRVTEVTYLGYVYCTLAALRRMLPRDQGTIVQVGSALAYRGIPLQSAYCGAKHAIQGFTESVRCELLHDKSHVKISMVQLPAVNTTQFGWVKCRLPRKPQPVPPIYQPEVAAKAITWAAHHYRREWWLGPSTIEAIVGNYIAPSFADHYLAATGYDSQQYDGHVEANRKDNLLEPVDDQVDCGSHGNFDARAHTTSYQFWLSKHLRTIAIGAGITACVVATGIIRRCAAEPTSEENHG
jgi:short-subunit dehydrogenase